MNRKKLSRILVSGLAGCLMFGLVGCGDSSAKTEGNKTEVSEAGKKDENSTSGEKSEENAWGFQFETEKFKGKEIEIWRWWDPSETEQKYVSMFEEATGAKVNFVNVPYNDYTAKLTTVIPSGTGPDIIEAINVGRPTWINKGLVQPWNDYLDLSTIPNLNNAITDFYTFDGKVYGLRASKGDPNIILYNKALFEEAGLDDPYELYKEGNWTWDALLEAGRNLIVDTNNDGTPDQYAFDGGGAEVALPANGANTIIMEDGQPKFGLDTPEAIKSIEFIRELNELRPPKNEDIGVTEMLASGKLAMAFLGAWDNPGIHDALGEDFGIAPFPVGPNAPEGLNGVVIGNPGAQQLASSSKEPELAGHWIQWSYWDKGRTPEQQEALVYKWKNEEILEEYYKWADSAWLDPVWGFGQAGSMIGEVYGTIDSTPAQKVQEIKAAVQAEIDNVWNSK